MNDGAQDDAHKQEAPAPVVFNPDNPQNPQPERKPFVRPPLARQDAVTDLRKLIPVPEKKPG